jgi:AcrR family transcriptional regulator
MRVLDAMARVAVEQGLHRTTVASVLARGSIAHATFYRHFRCLDDCFLALLDEVMGRTTELMSEAFAGDGSWPEKVVAALAALLAFLDAESVLARVYLVESMAGGPIALEHRARELRALVPLIDAGREYSSRSGREPSLDSAGIITATLGMLHDRLITGQAPPFMAQLGPLARFVLDQHLDAKSCAEAVAGTGQLARQMAHENSFARPAASSVEVPLPKALRHPNSFRLRSCVRYLAEHPGASNQAVAAGIDLRHHGQMSILLRRLERGGLLAKRPGRAGTPNAWTLTPDGEQAARILNSARDAVTSRLGPTGSTVQPTSDTHIKTK